MRPFKLVYSPLAHKLIRHLSPQIKRPLKFSIEELVKDPFQGKPLHDELEGFRSLRYKRYRVIYRIDEKQKRIEIVFAGSRSSVYQLFEDYLKYAKERL